MIISALATTNLFPKTFLQFAIYSTIFDLSQILMLFGISFSIRRALKIQKSSLKFKLSESFNENDVTYINNEYA